MVVESRMVFIQGTCGGFVTTYDSIFMTSVQAVINLIVLKTTLQDSPLYDKIEWLYIQPQYLSNLTWLIRYKESHISTIFVQVLMI